MIQTIIICTSVAAAGGFLIWRFVRSRQNQNRGQGCGGGSCGGCADQCGSPTPSVEMRVQGRTAPTTRQPQKQKSRHNAA